jgi:hypothetical protein
MWLTAREQNDTQRGCAASDGAEYDVCGGQVEGFTEDEHAEGASAERVNQSEGGQRGAETAVAVRVLGKPDADSSCDQTCKGRRDRGVTQPHRSDRARGQAEAGGGPDRIRDGRDRRAGPC